MARSESKQVIISGDDVFKMCAFVNAIVAGAALLTAPTAWAIDPTIHISQYSHITWRIQDGIFNGAPTAIAQTTNGYIWIGTENGLFRFDGVRFVSWAEVTNHEQLQSAEVSALLGASDGSLWIGAGYRLYRWKGDKLSNYSTGDEFISSIVETRQGALWLSRERQEPRLGALCQILGQGVHCYRNSDGIPLDVAYSLASDATGDLWVGGSSQIVRWRPASQTVWTVKALQRSEGLEGISALAVDKNNSVWAGVKYAEPGLGLLQLRGGLFKTFSTPEFNGAKIAVSRLFTDRDGALWVGTVDRGIYRIFEGKVDHFGSADGLSGDRVAALFQDHEGTIWVATSKGIDSFHDLSTITISKREGLHADSAQSILASRDGTIWIGNVGSLDAWRKGIVTSILPKDGLPGREVTALLEDTARRLWVGIDDGLFLLKRGKFTRVKMPGVPGLLTGIIDGANDSVWAFDATRGDVIRIRDGKVVERHTPTASEDTLTIASDQRGNIWLAGDTLGYLRDSAVTMVSEFGPRYGYIRTIAVDDDGFIWFGATKGLVGLFEGKPRAMTTANGLPCEWINALIFDNHRSLWLSAQCGLIKIDHGELERWRQHPNALIRSTFFDVTDGFQGGPSSFRPAATKSPDGRLWFINSSVVQTIDPDHLRLNSLPPPVHVEQVISDKIAYFPESIGQLPQFARNLEIKYTGLSFVVPQHVRFRYKLEGYDNDWQDAGTRRSAFYTNLSPGKYRFLVIACNNSGVWNSEGAGLEFVILPAWYQTVWFRLLVLSLLGLLGYFGYLLRMRQYAVAMRARLNERVDERMRIARDLHDTLLQSFHGLMFQFQAARNLLPRRPESAIEALDEAIDTTEQAIAEGRDAIHNLRLESTGQLDLAELLASTAGDLKHLHMMNGHSPSFRVVVEGKRQALSSTLQEELYRIGSELIRNAFHHAAANHIEVEIRYNAHQFRLRIRDDGKGIDSEVLKGNRRSGHWGLPGIRERAGRIGSSLEFWSETGAGTEVQLTVPASLAYEKQPHRHRFRQFIRGRSNDSHS